jgi:photosystem II stability/assembly factor-like uncharacterized protein
MNATGIRRLGFRHLMALIVCLVGCEIAVCDEQASDKVQALRRPALSVPRPQRSAMLAVAQAGGRLVSVGERGVILVSDDLGVNWRQVPAPVSVTLTAVRFVNDTAGWATGHSGVVLATTDRGETWVRQLDGVTAAGLALSAAKALEQRLGPDSPVAKRALTVATQLKADGPDKPFLDLHFWDERKGIVVGAYGMAFTTEDGGRTWESAFDRLDNPKGLHLNAVTGAGQYVVIAGEQGLVLRSTDGGQQFARVETPYRGSWFAVHADTEGHLVLGGLRGNAYFSPDFGATWSRIDFGAPSSITAVVAGGPNRLLATNQVGSLFASKNGGRSFDLLPARGAAPLAAVAAVDKNTFVVAGLRGLQRIDNRGEKP